MGYRNFEFPFLGVSISKGSWGGNNWNWFEFFRPSYANTIQELSCWPVFNWDFTWCDIWDGSFYIFLGAFSFSFEISPLWGSTIGAFSALGLQLLINRGFEHTHRLLLTGLVLGFVFSAATELMQYFGNNEQLREFTFWGMGNFERIEIEHLLSISIPVITGIVLVYFFLKFIRLLFTW